MLLIYIGCLFGGDRDDLLSNFDGFPIDVSFEFPRVLRIVHLEQSLLSGSYLNYLQLPQNSRFLGEHQIELIPQISHNKLLNVRQLVVSALLEELLLNLGFVGVLLVLAVDR